MQSLSQLDPADELMHAPTTDREFNESMYFSYVDTDARHGTLLRIGNRVNDGYTELSVIVYEPQGSLAFRYDRLPLAENSWFSAGGLEFELLEPLRRMRVTYDGTARRLNPPARLERGRDGLVGAKDIRVMLDLRFESKVPLYGLGGSGASGLAGGADAVALGHYQGPCQVTGTEIVDGQQRLIQTTGFRDHSWGPRRWQQQRWWRWISGMTDPGNGFVAWLTHDSTGKPNGGTGVLLRDGEYIAVDQVTVATTFAAESPHYPTGVVVTLGTARGKVRVTGSVRHLAPLRNSSKGRVARIVESLAEYDFQGRPAYGFAEFHDLMIDGAPAGLGIA